MKTSITTCMKDAAHALMRGQLVAFPTETVYGLGANAYDEQAVQRIFKAKQRPSFNPLIVHVVDLEMAQNIGRFDDYSLALAQAFWPGPLTLVVPLRDQSIAASVLAGGTTIALRVPSHPLAHELLREANLPVAAPSANLSGKVSSTRSSHVEMTLAGRIDYILDGEVPCIGIESTIVLCNTDGIEVLRSGTITEQDIEQVIGSSKHANNSDKPIMPGSLKSHYAPNARLRLNSDNVEDDEALISFGPTALTSPIAHFSLSEKGDLSEAAYNLYAILQGLDERQISKAAVTSIPEFGIGIALNDRLKRAAYRTL